MNGYQREFIFLLHKHGIWLQDTLSILYNLRPCMRYKITKERYFLLKRILPSLGLKMIIYKRRNQNCLIGKDRSLLREAYMFDVKQQHSNMGKLLGYPECCIKFWQEFKNKEENSPIYSKRNTKTKLDFKLNYLFNFDTRIRTGYLQYIYMLQQKGYNLWDKYLIPHIACSFDCNLSKEYANKLEMILKNYFPKYLLELKKYLKKPLLFINNYEFLLFDGIIKGNVLFYTKAFHVNNLFKIDLFNKIVEGNKIQLEDDHFIIFKNNSIIDKVNIKAELFNFE